MQKFNLTPVKNNILLKGTLILTATGLLTRLLGFFYRIFLSHTIGAVNLGIYQLIFPVFGICFTLYGAGIQTTISKLTAEDESQNSKTYLKLGCILSFLIACTLSLMLYLFAAPIAEHFLQEKRCEIPLKILSFVFPFCCISSCINGYYYGKKKTCVPSIAQLLEQLSRIGLVYLLSLMLGKNETYFSCEIAVWGLVAGEFVSFVFNVCSLFFEKKEDKKPTKRQKRILRKILGYSIPLTGTRLLINLLASAESILIPLLLRKNGVSQTDALATLGILNGMAIPFLMFPSTIPNSMAVILLPSVSEAYANKKTEYLGKLCQKSIGFCLKMGILTTSGFLLFGYSLGLCFFHNETAGSYLTILAWLCPFLYLATTLSSILNGLGKTSLTFRTSFLCSAVRILCLFLLIPKKGIYGYFIGLLVSQLLSVLINYLSLKRFVKFSLFLSKDIIIPATAAATGMIITLFLKYILHTRDIISITGLFFYGSIFLLVSILMFIALTGRNHTNPENSKEQ